MEIPKDIAELTRVFESLGARDPESWAASQIQEGIPQLQRFLFLRQAWAGVIQDGDTAWIDVYIDDAKRSPTAPFAGVGHALKRALDRGVAEQDLTDIARGLQAALLFKLCYLLDDPGLTESQLQDMAWGLFEVDSNDQPIRRIGGLHESVLETDPTDREMRPSDAG